MSSISLTTWIFHTFHTCCLCVMRIYVIFFKFLRYCPALFFISRTAVLRLNGSSRLHASSRPLDEKTAPITREIVPLLDCTAIEGTVRPQQVRCSGARPGRLRWVTKSLQLPAVCEVRLRRKRTNAMTAIIMAARAARSGNSMASVVMIDEPRNSAAASMGFVSPPVTVVELARSRVVAP